jgi:hypothetical protein
VRSHSQTGEPIDPGLAWGELSNLAAHTTQPIVWKFSMNNSLLTEKSRCCQMFAAKASAAMTVHSETMCHRLIVLQPRGMFSLRANDAEEVPECMP